MNVLISSQAHIFFISIFSGILMGIGYDIIRIIRRLFPHNRIFIGIEDILFFLISSILIFIKIFKANYGTIRGFILLGILLGVLLYYLTISNLIINTSIKIINKGTYVFKTYLITPIKIATKPIRFLLKKLIFILKKIRKWLIIRIREIKRQIRHIHNNI